MRYIVQYSRPTDERIAISDWIEYKTTVMATSITNAREVLRKKMGDNGTWSILDIWEDK